MVDQTIDLPGAASALEIRDRLIELRLVVGEHTDGQNGGHGRQIPVGPVVVEASAVMLTEKPRARGVEERDHQVLQALEVRRHPAGIVAQELCASGKLIAVKPGAKLRVRVTTECLQRSRPSVQDRDRLIRVRRGSGNTVAERILVCRGGIACERHIVLAVRAVSRAHVTLRVGSVARLGEGIGGQLFPA